MPNKEEFLMFICVFLYCTYQSNTDRDVFEEMKSAKEDGSLDSILVREALVYCYVALWPFIVFALTFTSNFSLVPSYIFAL